MNKGAFFTLLCCFPLSGAFPQIKQEFPHADAIAKSAPDSVETSIKTLSEYFQANLTSEKELIRAFYYWTANEIAYDVENMFSYRSADNPDVITAETLRDRKAVCLGYAEVFHALCTTAGIDSYVVRGYTRQNGQVVSIPHAWVAARTDTTWYFFDPTWASGFIMNGKFTRKFSNEYFMIRPSVFIKTHMPFDPLWQCLYHPLSVENFYQGVIPENNTAGSFSFPDSIIRFKQLSAIDQYAAAMRRLEKSGIGNSAILEYQRFLRQNLEIDRTNRQNELQNQKVNRFNEAVKHYNSAAFMFNDYVSYWNRQFKPARPDARIREMLDSCDYHLAQSRKILAAIDSRDETLSQNMEMLYVPVQEIQKHVDEQKEFLRDYFGTPKALRPALFRKYTLLGLPVK